MGEANAFARLVLGARALEKIEHARLIALRDAAAVVGDLDLDTVVGNRASPYVDVQRPLLRPIFDSVVEQVADDQLQRETIAFDGGHIEIDVDFPAGLGQLMLDRGRGAGDDLPEVDGLGLQRSLSFARELENRIDQSFHFLARGANVSDRFGQQFGDGGTRFLQVWIVGAVVGIGPVNEPLKSPSYPEVRR